MNGDEDVLWQSFLMRHPEFGAVDPNWMNSETYSAWSAHLKKVADLKPIIESATSEEEPETPLARKIRTGQDNWLANEWDQWKLAGRTAKEFRDAFAPEDDEPEPTILRRLRTGQQ
jgi:hypothetical protein